MSTSYYEYGYESESLPEMEGLYESEWVGESEATYESEQFFQELAQAARRAAPLPALQRLAMASARAALSSSGAPDAYSEPEGFLWEGEGEGEGAFEGEGEVQMEQALHYMGQVPSAALMEHLGHAAAEAETEGESFAFLAPLIPLAMKALPLAAKGLGILGKKGIGMAAKMAAKKMLPKMASNMSRGVPNMVRSLQGVAKTLRQSPRTRPLVRTLPTVARRATADLARQAARGRPITPRVASRAVARHTAKVIGNPAQAVRAFQTSRVMDKKFHQAAGSAVTPPPEVAAAAATNGVGVSPDIMAGGMSPDMTASPGMMSGAPDFSPMGVAQPQPGGGKKCCCSCGG